MYDKWIRWFKAMYILNIALTILSLCIAAILVIYGFSPVLALGGSVCAIGGVWFSDKGRRNAEEFRKLLGGDEDESN